MRCILKLNRAPLEPSKLCRSQIGKSSPSSVCLCQGLGQPKLKPVVGMERARYLVLYPLQNGEQQV
eukprot:1140736-Pelagomonas_calceolata.AAC.6